MKNKNIIAVTNLLQSLDFVSLRNQDVIINLIRAFGLVQWGPPVFGQEELFRNPTEDMAGIYQTPAQLFQALIYLSSFPINSYLEIGVFQGGNFIFTSSYLRRFNPEIKCLGIDPTGFLNPEVREIIDLSDWMHVAQVNSDRIAGKEYDLVLIDGDHSKEWIERDWKNVGQRAKICMFHDIQESTCPDIVAFWNNIKTIPDRTVREFTDYTGDVPLHGLGILNSTEHQSSLSPKSSNQLSKKTER